jgi:hypothetical protein
MGPIRSPKTSVKNYHSTLRNIPEERRSHLHRDVTHIFLLSSSRSQVISHATRAQPSFPLICNQTTVIAGNACCVFILLLRWNMRSSGVLLGVV